MVLFAVIAIVALLYIGQTAYYERNWTKGLKASLTFNTNVARIGDEVELVEEIDNGKWLPLPHLNVKFMTSSTFDFVNKDNSMVSDHYYRNDIFTLLGYQKTIRTLKFRTTKRGYYEISDIDLISGDIFFRRTFAKQEHNYTGIYVYPNLLEKGQYPFMITNREGDNKAPLSFNINQYLYRGMREYEAGDPFNHINWKRSAKEQKLMTNIYTPVIDREVTLLVNLKPFYENVKDAMSEYIISITATLADLYIRSGINVHLYTNAYEGDKSTPFYMPHLDSVSRIDNLMKGLSMLNTSREPADIIDVMRDIKQGESRDNRVLVMVSNDRTNQLISAYSALKKHYSDSCFIMPEFDSVPIKLEIPDMVYWEVKL